MLHYIGQGAFLPDVPARDLSEDEIKDIAERAGVTPKALTKQLIATGLYAPDKAPSNEA